MTRKHFELIAGSIRETVNRYRNNNLEDVIRAGVAEAAIRSLTINLAAELAAVLPNFDSGRFTKACLRSEDAAGRSLGAA
jgi:hypothetical protein